MVPGDFDLAVFARNEMLHEGFEPDFPPETDQQLAAIKTQKSSAAGSEVRDLRDLLWSSIDNDTSRDLDQVEFAERVEGGIRVLVGIADVDSVLPLNTPAVDRIEAHAARQTTTVYTAVKNFPMLPEALSTDLTSLRENADRLVVVTEMMVKKDGTLAASSVFRALIRNHAQLTYDSVGAWLEKRAPPDRKVAASDALQVQLQLQNEAAGALRAQRNRMGAIHFDRVEPVTSVAEGRIRDISAAKKNCASDLIEDFMIAANETIAQTLRASGTSSIRRVVRAPERWPRIVALAAQSGVALPAQPDSGALSAFLERQRNADPVHYADLSLAVVKLMGPGEYAMMRANDPAEGHFGLAASDYTHSTAPNRRYADLVTQRLIKAVMAKTPVPYSDEALGDIARNCTLRQGAARKVERVVGKSVAAVAMRRHVGQSFDAVVTGVNARGTFVRVTNPPVEGMLCRGQVGVDVGDRIRVTLLATDPARGYIDFGR